MNIVKGSFRIFPKLSRGIVENGVKICWLLLLHSYKGDKLGKIIGKQMTTCV